MTSIPQPDSNSSGPAPVPPRRRFRETAIASGLLDAAQIDAAEAAVRLVLGSRDSCAAAVWDKAVADELVSRELLTGFQAEQMLLGRSKLTLGQYCILDQVGQGGMGRVFKARHAVMRRIVAVKVLPKDKETPATEAAFLREIERLGDLDHDNLLRALDAGRDGKVHYLVTEYIEGLDLRRQVLKHGRLGEVAAASVIAQAARGLAYAHEKGIVHRDVKPGNLLVTKDGRVKVLDLGLAGSVFDAKPSGSGRVVGTMDYMAPEQIRAPNSARAPADVYGLGCTLYFLLVGKVPFPGGTREEKAQRQLFESPAAIQALAPHVSTSFCAVVDAMMRKDPAARIASAEEVIERLRPWTPDAPVAMPRTQSPAATELPQQSSSRESTQGIFSLSEETAAGSGGNSDQFTTTAPQRLPEPQFSGKPIPAATTATSAIPTSNTPQATRPVSRSGEPRGLLAQTIHVLAGRIARVVMNLLRQEDFKRNWPTGLRMLAVAGTVAFLFSWATATLDSFLHLFPKGFPGLVGWLAFAVLLGVQVWAAVTGRVGDD